MKPLNVRKIIITHALFTGDQVIRELSDLGYQIRQQDKLHVEITGTLHDAIKLNLYLRTAHRVLYHISHFDAINLNDLYSEIKKIHWEEIIPLKGYFSIHSFVRQKDIHDFRIVNLKMKDAIVDRFHTKYKNRPDSGNRQDHLVLFIRWVNDAAEVYLDTSGETLAKHGYRRQSWKAPLSESLAAAIIYSMNWDLRIPFINPMCGSGTLAIEAALMASNRYPGIYRDNYSFLHLNDSPTEIYLELKKELSSIIDRNNHTLIIATDIHPGAIRQAKLNAQQAGIYDLIKFETADFQESSIPDPPGIIILNPGYGKRLGEEKILEPVYEQIGDFFKQKCKGYTGYVFTGNLNLSKKIGLRTKRKIPYLNGNIECRLLEYELYAGSRKKADKE